MKIINRAATCAAMLWAIALQAAPRTQISATWPGVTTLSASEHAMLIYNLEFAGSAYRLTYNRLGWRWSVRGTYRIEAEQILLKPDIVEPPETPQPMFTQPLLDASCQVVEDLTNMFFSEFLECKSAADPKTVARFSIPESAVGPGAERTIDGVKAIRLAGKPAKVTRPVALRKTPNANGEEIEITQSGMYGQPMPALKLMQPGFEVMVAEWRTKDTPTWVRVVIRGAVMGGYGLTHEGWLPADALDLQSGEKLP